MSFNLGLDYSSLSSSSSLSSPSLLNDKSNPSLGLNIPSLNPTPILFPTSSSSPWSLGGQNNFSMPTFDLPSTTNLNTLPNSSNLSLLNSSGASNSRFSLLSNQPTPSRFNLGVDLTFPSIPLPPPSHLTNANALQFSPTPLLKNSSDPSLEIMKSTTITNIESRLEDRVKELAKEHLDKLPKNLRDKEEEFLNFTGKAIHKAISTGEFLASASEKGFEEAGLEKAQEIVTDFVAKNGAKIAGKVLGCSNPVTFVEMLIADLLTPTELAHDMDKPPHSIQVPPLSSATQSQLPIIIENLDPIYPTFRNPKM